MRRTYGPLASVVVSTGNATLPAVGTLASSVVSYADGPPQNSVRTAASTVAVTVICPLTVAPSAGALKLIQGGLEVASLSWQPLQTSWSTVRLGKPADPSSWQDEHSTHTPSRSTMAGSGGLKYPPPDAEIRYEMRTEWLFWSSAHEWHA